MRNFSDPTDRREYAQYSRMQAGNLASAPKEMREEYLESKKQETITTLSEPKTNDITIETVDLNNVPVDLLLSIKNNDTEVDTLIGRLISIDPNDDEIDKRTKQIIIDAVKERIKTCDKHLEFHARKEYIENDFQYWRKCIQWLLKMHKVAKKYDYKLIYIDDIFDHIYFTPLSHSWRGFGMEALQDIMPNAGQEEKRLELYLEEQFEPSIKEKSNMYKK